MLLNLFTMICFQRIYIFVDVVVNVFKNDNLLFWNWKKSFRFWNNFIVYELDHVKLPDSLTEFPAVLYLTFCKGENGVCINYGWPLQVKLLIIDWNISLNYYSIFFIKSYSLKIQYTNILKKSSFLNNFKIKLAYNKIFCKTSVLKY